MRKATVILCALTLITAAGCAGRSDVTEDDQKANSLPSRPRATPQMHPGAPLPLSTQPATRAATRPAR